MALLLKLWAHKKSADSSHVVSVLHVVANASASEVHWLVQAAHVAM